MQQVINAKQRNRAFWKFLLFFVVTIALILFAVYFDFRTPDRENAFLRDQVLGYRALEGRQQQYIDAMETTRAMIDSLGKPQVNTAYYSSLIGGRLKEMVVQDSSSFGRINKTMLNTFLSYEDLKMQFLDLRDAPQKIQDLTTRLQKSESDLDQCKRDNELFRAAASH